MSKKDTKKELAHDEISDLKQGHKDKALLIVKDILPKKVKDLTAGLETGPLFKHDLKQISAGFTIEPSLDASRKKRKLDETTSMEVDGVKKTENNIPINKFVSDIIEALKKEILFFVEQINIVKLWIQLNIPRIEDGNNFGVSIQEEALNELTRAEDSAFTSLDQMTKYFVTRAKLVAKCIKYPQIQDYHQSVIELDEKEYIDLRVSWKDLRNNYAILYDVIMKNFEKIIRPRSDNSVTLY